MQRSPKCNVHYGTYGSYHHITRKTRKEKRHEIKNRGILASTRRIYPFHTLFGFSTLPPRQSTVDLSSTNVHSGCIYDATYPNSSVP
jgi:hypothetical protein